MAEPRKVGQYRPKSYMDMQQQVNRIQGEGWRRMMGIVEQNIERRRAEKEGEGGRRFDTSDRDRAIYEAQNSPEYQRMLHRMNRSQEYLNRQRPELEPEPIDIFDSNVGAEERRRNLARMERRTRTRR